MKTRSISRVCLLVVGLVSASLQAGCVAATPEDAEDPGAAAEALSLPDVTYDFSKDLKFCETIDYVFGSTKVCSPSLSFAGSVTLGDYQTFPIIDQPENVLVTLDMNQPFNATTSVRVGLVSSNGGVCYNASQVSGVDLKVCADAVNLAVDGTTRVYSFRMKLTVKGAIEVDGVGISETVDLYETPTINVPF
jgi:hypothetical protein